MLSPYRVLDLTDDRGHLAGLLFAQLGADVVLVEPPGGSRARHLGPFVDDVPHPGRSLQAWAFDRGKASVELRTFDDPLLAELAAGADVLLECGAFPVDVAALRANNPALVTVSISAFGGDGPKAHWAATDLVVAAASGTMGITGDRDRAPLRISEPQTWNFAALDAFVGASIALRERHRSGIGQHVDVSAQQAFLTATQFQMMNGLVGGRTPQRVAGGVELGPFHVQFVYDCADGAVTVTFLFGPMIGRYTTRLWQWIHEEGSCEADLATKNWIDFAMDVFEGREPPSELDRATAVLQAFLRTRTKAELFEVALERNLLIAPVTTTADVLAMDQLADRGYWEEIDGIRYPGRFVEVPGLPLRPLGPAPQLDTDRERLAATPRRPAAPPVVRTAATDDDRPLAGLRILDFMWAMAGPAATRTLADFGATVVRVESQRRPDVLRGVNPFRAAEGDQEGALQWHSLNAGKYGLALDLTAPEAREVVLDLVRWADVVTEAFSAGTMDAWGLGFDDLRAVNPKLVMLSSCLMGQSGPLRAYAGFGTMAAAVAGFYPVTGWPDRRPAGPFTAFTDYVSPRFAAGALLAALDRRDRTGEAVRLDFSQLEGALLLLGTAILDDEVNGRTAAPVGNADRTMAPHGVFTVPGDDRWIAVAVETDDQWRALCGIVDRADLAGLDAAERIGRRDELDAVVAAWAARTPGEEAEAALQAVGVPAHRVQDAADCVADPQLRHRGMFREVPHERYGTTFVEGPPFQLSRTPGGPRWGGPTFGQHLQEVLGGFLGYDDERIAELVIAGVLE